MSVRILTGDCRDVLKALPECSATLAFTSPPYAIRKDYERELDEASWLALMRATIAEVARVTTDSIVWQVGSRVMHAECVPLDILVAPMFWELGWTLRNRIIWHTPAGLHSTKRFSGRHEAALWFTRGDAYTFNLDAVRVPQKYPGKRAFKGARRGELTGNPLGKNPGDIWEIAPIGHNNGEKTGHPAQMPEELARRFILALTNPGDTVLDPFAGSGTSGIVAQSLERNAILIELNPEYAAMAERRIRGDAPMFADIQSTERVT